MRNVVVAAAAGLLLAGCADAPAPPSPGAASTTTTCAGPDCGADDTGESEPAAPVAGVGETIRFRDSGGVVGTITLHKLERSTVVDGGNGYSVSPTYGAFLVADIEVTIEEGVSMATPLTFEARAPDGTEFVSEIGVVADLLDEPRLAAGQHVRGDVAFDVPEGEWFIDYEISDAPLATFEVVG